MIQIKDMPEFRDRNEVLTMAESAKLLTAVDAMVNAGIMTVRVQTANENDSVTDCLRRMSNGRFRHMPVVNDNGKLLGMMSQGDFVAYTWPEIWRRVKEHASIVVNNKYQPLLILGGVLVYTIILFLLVKLFV